MADPVIPADTASAVAIAPATPVPAPASIPPAVVADAPATAGTGAADPSPAAPESAAPAVAAKAEPSASLLGDAKPATEPKPAEAAPAPVPAEPAAPPSYEAFTLPENVTLDAEKVGELQKILGETELATKADHAAMQGLGQKMVDLYVAEMQRVSQAQQDSWIRTRDEWRNRFVDDPDIGGARRESTLRDCAQIIEQFGGTPEQQAELRQAFGITGMGDHPAMIRLLNNVARVTKEGRPVPASVPRSPVTASKSARRYSNTLNGAN